MLAEHALGEKQKDQKAGGERRLDHDQRSQQQGDDLQRPAEHRQTGAGQPAGSPQQVAHQRQAQVLVCGRLLGIHRLEGDP
jgi:hypothetical protein